MENNHIFIKKIIIASILGAICGYCGDFYVVSVLLCSISAYIMYKLQLSKKLLLSALFILVSTIVYYVTKNNSYGIVKHILSILNVLLPALTLCAVTEKGTSDLRVAVHGVMVANLLISLIELGIFKLINKINIYSDYLIPYINNFQKEYTSALLSQPTTVEYAEQFTKYFDIIREYLITFMPVLLMGICMFIAFVTVEVFMFLANKSRKKNNEYTIKMSKFDSFEPIPCSGTVLFVLLLIVILGKNNIFTNTCSNLIAFIMLEYSICGLAVIYYLISHRLKLKGVLKVLVCILSIPILCIISFAFGGLLNILLLLGMFDSTFNFRKLDRSERLNR